jgi:hypothetical protein
MHRFVKHTTQTLGYLKRANGVKKLQKKCHKIKRLQDTNCHRPPTKSVSSAVTMMEDKISAFSV